MSVEWDRFSQLEIPTWWSTGGCRQSFESRPAHRVPSFAVVGIFVAQWFDPGIPQGRTNGTANSLECVTVVFRSFRNRTKKERKKQRDKKEYLEIDVEDENNRVQAEVNHWSILIIVLVHQIHQHIKPSAHEEVKEEVRHWERKEKVGEWETCRLKRCAKWNLNWSTSAWQTLQFGISLSCCCCEPVTSPLECLPTHNYQPTKQRKKKCFS